MVANPQDRIAELSVMQNSPARAGGVAIATKANVHSATAEAVTILEIGFIFLSVSSWSFPFAVYLSIDR
jgi:hypothetical protein